jgi:hypothetical protein
MKKRVKRDKSVSQAMAIAVASAFGVGIIIGVAMLLMQYSSYRTLYDLISANQSGEMEKSDLYLRLNMTRAQFDIATTALCTLVAGMVFGKLAPRYLTFKKTLGFSTLVQLIFVSINLGFVWSLKLLNQGGHLSPYDLAPEYVKAQSLACVGWILIGVFGTLISRIVSNKTRKDEDESATRTAPKTKATAARQ